MHFFVECRWLRPGGILRQPQPFPFYTAHFISSAIYTALLSVCLPREWKLAQSLMLHACLPFSNYFPILNQSTSTYLWLWLLDGCFWSARGWGLGRHERNGFPSRKSLTSMAMTEELQVSVFPQSFNTQYLFSCLSDEGLPQILIFLFLFHTVSDSTLIYKEREM